MAEDEVAQSILEDTISGLATSCHPGLTLVESDEVDVFVSPSLLTQEIVTAAATYTAS